MGHFLILINESEGCGCRGGSKGSRPRKKKSAPVLDWTQHCNVQKIFLFAHKNIKVANASSRKESHPENTGSAPGLIPSHKSEFGGRSSDKTLRNKSSFSEPSDVDKFQCNPTVCAVSLK